LSLLTGRESRAIRVTHRAGPVHFRELSDPIHESALDFAQSVAVGVLVLKLLGCRKIFLVGPLSLFKRQQELIRAAPAVRCLSAAEFLTNGIGCCDGYARLMKYLLDTARITNRLVVIPNHIFNEIEVSGRRFVVDANSGLIFDRSWEELSTHPDQRVFVYTLPLVGLMDAASANYRPRLGQLRSVLVRTVAPGRCALGYQDRNAPVSPSHRSHK
jgi:hypothetical protein